MKKLIAIALSVGLLAGAYAMPAEAGKRKKKKKVVKVTREVQGTYAAPATAVGLCGQTDAVGCVTIPSGAEEQYVTATVTDDSGQPVLISIQADLDGDAQSDTTYGVFCGETAEPIQVDSGVELIFWISPASQAPARATEGCIPGQGTSGVLDVTLSNLP